MAFNNAVNELGSAPIGSVARYDFTAPTYSGWLECDGSAISTTTYSGLYDVVGNSYEGTGNLTQVDQLSGESNKGCLSVRWHPSSNYVAYGESITGGGLGVASFNGTTLTEVETINLSSESYCVDWHPDGDYLAVALYTGHTIKIYSWNGTDTLAEVESIDTTYNCQYCGWHPDGDFLAVQHSVGGTDELSIYSWNGTDTLSQVETVDVLARNTIWSHSGDYLAICTAIANSQLMIYSWNGSDTLTYVCKYDYSGTYAADASWSLDDDFIAVGGSNDAKQLVVLSFNGTSLTERTSIDYGTSLRGHPMWSRGGNYLSNCIHGNTSTVDVVFLYSWVPSTYTLTEVDKIQMGRVGSFGADFNYTNNYIAYGCYFAESGAPYYKLYAGTTALTSCDYRTNFPLPTTADHLIRAK